MEQSKSNIILYQTADGTVNIEVTLANDTVWLTADQMAELFQRDRSTIQRHIRSIYQDNELSQDSTCAFFAQVQKEGNRQVERQNWQNRKPMRNMTNSASVHWRSCLLSRFTFWRISSENRKNWRNSPVIKKSCKWLQDFLFRKNRISNLPLSPPQSSVNFHYNNPSPILPLPPTHSIHPITTSITTPSPTPPRKC